MPRRPRDLGVPQSPADYFASELRAYREAAGLSRPQLSELLGYTPQWIGQIEQRQATPSEAFAKDCDTFFKTNGSFHRNWKWMQQIDEIQILPPGFSEFLEREAEAALMYKFEAMAVTGLFQTWDYAFEVLKNGRTREEAEQLVATRLARQEILTGEDPPGVVAIFDEAVIRRPVGSDTIMRAQLERLVDLAELPHITMHVVPFSKGAYAGVMGSMTLLGFDDGSDLVYIDGHVGGQLITQPSVVRQYARRFDLIRGVAEPADASLRLVQAALECL
ncbi:helix-turn-helix transcriptional regulator [Actinomadura sp. NPDC047616]|uniref:helix-turn-helix domain-containing protein n=1 Tax=Actinomadura sp. NPDC047616 TaxID=3155914 RepID=UPI0033E223D9